MLESVIKWAARGAHCGWEENRLFNTCFGYSSHGACLCGIFFPVEIKTGGVKDTTFTCEDPEPDLSYLLHEVVLTDL